MNAVRETIAARRAVRHFEDRAVEKPLIERVIEAGKWAPSAMNEQSWIFYVLTDKLKIRRLSGEIAHAGFWLKGRTPGEIKAAALALFHLPALIEPITQQDHIFYDAPVVIFITAPDGHEWAGLNTGLCAQNMMLAASSLGLDTCPIGLARLADKAEHYTDLEIPPGEHIELAVIVGYGVIRPDAQPRAGNNVIYL